MWELGQGEDKNLPALRLSYCQLPSLVKPRFVYCLMFPKSHRFKKDELIWLWMAQGYIQPRERSSLEETYSKYFDQLLRRSFFQMSPVLGAKFTMSRQQSLQSSTVHIMESGRIPNPPATWYPLGSIPLASTSAHTSAYNRKNTTLCDRTTGEEKEEASPSLIEMFVATHTKDELKATQEEYLKDHDTLEDMTWDLPRASYWEGSKLWAKRFHVDNVWRSLDL